MPDTLLDDELEPLPDEPEPPLPPLELPLPVLSPPLAPVLALVPADRDPLKPPRLPDAWMLAPLELISAFA